MAEINGYQAIKQTDKRSLLEDLSESKKAQKVEIASIKLKAKELTLVTAITDLNQGDYIKITDKPELNGYYRVKTQPSGDNKKITIELLAQEDSGIWKTTREREVTYSTSKPKVFKVPFTTTQLATKIKLPEVSRAEERIATVVDAYEKVYTGAISYGDTEIEVYLADEPVRNISVDSFENNEPVLLVVTTGSYIEEAVVCSCSNLPANEFVGAGGHVKETFTYKTQAYKRFKLNT